jgi:hypothetical protein
MRQKYHKVVWYASGRYKSRDILPVKAWCQKTFGDGGTMGEMIDGTVHMPRWWCAWAGIVNEGVNPKYEFFFTSEEDATLFRLKWL